MDSPTSFSPLQEEWSDSEGHLALEALSRAKEARDGVDIEDCVVSVEVEDPEGSLIRTRIGELFGLDAKSGQVEALKQLLYEKQDLVLIAKTGYGKSIIFQAAPLIASEVGICLIVMPLTLLQVEQCSLLENIPTARPIVLDGQSNNRQLREAIGKGIFTHVFVSPEIALSRQFTAEILQQPSFQERLVLLAIDELHIVNEWGNSFRKHYGELRLLRNRMPSDVPVLGVTATLDPETFDSVMESVGFQDDVTVMRTSIDRPEIYFTAEPFLCPVNGMLDLKFLLPKNISGPCDIPKTIIYMNEIKLTHQGLLLMRQWMKELNYPAQAANWVRVVHSQMAESDKRKTVEDFSKLSDQCQDCRIVLATDSLGLGMNNPDVLRVVQWDLPPSPNTLVQRMGRASRNRKNQADFLLLHPPWCVETQVESETRQTTPMGDILEAPVGSDQAVVSTRRKRGTGTKLNAEKRRKMNRLMFELINVNQCQRRRILAHYDDKTYNDPTAVSPQFCCAVCHPEHKRDRTVDQSQSLESDPSRQAWREAELEKWRDQKSYELFRGSPSCRCPSIVMADARLTLVAKMGNHIKDLETLQRFGGPWGDYLEYGPEVVEIAIKSMTFTKDPSSPLTLARDRKRERKRARSSLVDEATPKRRISRTPVGGSQPTGDIAASLASKKKQPRVNELNGRTFGSQNLDSGASAMFNVWSLSSSQASSQDASESSQDTSLSNLSQENDLEGNYMRENTFWNTEPVIYSPLAPNPQTSQFYQSSDGSLTAESVGRFPGLRRGSRPALAEVDANAGSPSRMASSASPINRPKKCLQQPPSESPMTFVFYDPDKKVGESRASKSPAMNSSQATASTSSESGAKAP